MGIVRGNDQTLVTKAESFAFRRKSVLAVALDRFFLCIFPKHDRAEQNVEIDIFCQKALVSCNWSRKTCIKFLTKLFGRGWKQRGNSICSFQLHLFWPLWRSTCKFHIGSWTAKTNSPLTDKSSFSSTVKRMSSKTLAGVRVHRFYTITLHLSSSAFPTYRADHLKHLKNDDCVFVHECMFVCQHT